MKSFGKWFNEQGEYQPKTQPDKTVVDPVCACCGGSADPDIVCKRCDEIVCEDCLVCPAPPPIIDFNLCKCCYNYY